VQKNQKEQRGWRLLAVENRRTKCRGKLNEGKLIKKVDFELNVRKKSVEGGWNVGEKYQFWAKGGRGLKRKEY